ncbi:MAG: hypothetical protein MJZ11_08595 [Lachnospiraceae bacterium]|nr:hypothetical protein [Lachnospiraceae bacterium]
MKKFLIVFMAVIMVVMTGCSANMIAAANQEREADAARYQSEYAKTVNKLEMSESNFKNYRRVSFYNVRLGEIVFACEGYCHVQIDRDGDVEIVVKVGEGEFLRHYLGQKQDITYFSEQLKPSKNIDNFRYKIVWNPNNWIPVFDSDL